MTDIPLDRIKISELSFRCIIGVNEDERREKQDIVADVTMYADLRKACVSDDIKDSVDYKQIKQQILKTVENSRCHLIENLAQKIADCCLTHPMVRRVTVSVEKPGALRFARTVGVRITRSRNSTND